MACIVRFCAFLDVSAIFLTVARVGKTRIIAVVAFSVTVVVSETSISAWIVVSLLVTVTREVIAEARGVVGLVSKQVISISKEAKLSVVVC